MAAGAAVRQAVAALGSLLAVLVLVSACSSNSSSGGEGARYEQIVKPANAAWANFVTQARGWPDGTIPVAGPVLAQDVVKAWEQVNAKLLAQHWSGAAKGDIAALVRSDTAVCHVLEELPPPGAAAAWWTSLTTTFSAEQQAAGQVRVDLHLPTSAGANGGNVPATT